MKEPVDHILRSRLPWRGDEGAITECGYNAATLKTLTRDEFFAREKDLGRQRSAMITCMTCSDTVRRWGTWEDDPRRAVGREIEWEYGDGYRPRDDRGNRLKDELIAIADLIQAHREEFDASIRELEQRRDWLSKKSELAQKNKPPTRRERGGL